MKIKTNKLIVTILVLSFSLACTAQVRAEEVQKPPIAERIKANMENRLEKNKDIRNLEMVKRATTSVPMLRNERAKMLRATSTDSLMFKRNQENRRELVKTMEARIFEQRKQALVKQLSVAIRNLDNIATRIQSRITKAETSGRNMTQAKTLFVDAQNLLAKAKIDVAVFEALNIASSTNTTASTTAEVELTKPRALGDTAIKSVKAARDAMRKVVVAIAHGMGLKIGDGRNATSTNATTTDTTATSTATSTNN